MADFENPYATEDPFVEAPFGCPECGGKLWEYGIQRRMVCEDCRALFETAEIFERRTN